ncbi:MULTISPECIES: hypothetical protein [unclassified Caballeronia]|uniref:hypothetical protein n=1 Tax=unclassified Caballeronia TaxID=2646786 RepID=UPI00202983FE|nr:MULTISPECIES: hypothetical protein [unclassified Caballeronia]
MPALNLAIANAGEISSGSADAHRNREALPDWLDKALGDQSDLPDIQVNCSRCTCIAPMPKWSIGTRSNEASTNSCAGRSRAVFGEMVLDLVNKQKAGHASVRTA